MTGDCSLCRQFFASTKSKPAYSRAYRLLLWRKNFDFLWSQNCNKRKYFREAKLAAQDLIKKGCNSVVLTLGDKGALYLEKSSPESVYHTSPSVNCIDSTGAGDAFVGAFAFFLANYKNLSIEKMIESACYIAADSVTRPGTQKSFSGREILEKCLKAVFLTR